MNQYKNQILCLISDGLGEEPQSILNNYKKNGFVNLEKLDYIQIICKLEAILDINTGWLNREDYRLDIDLLSKQVFIIVNDRSLS